MNDLLVRNGQLYEIKPVDLTEWHVIDIPIELATYLYTDPDAELAWLKERDIKHRYGTVSYEGDVGHKLAYRFYFPPEQARDAMLFKLIWGGA